MSFVTLKAILQSILPSLVLSPPEKKFKNTNKTNKQTNNNKKLHLNQKTNKKATNKNKQTNKLTSLLLLWLLDPEVLRVEIPQQRF